MERLTASDDARLADYRDLKDPSARRQIEGDDFFVAEGPTSIERLLASDHRIRSVLVTESGHRRLEPLLTGLAAPVYVVDRELLHAVVGFDMHRGAIAAADRRRHPSLDGLMAGARRLAVLEGLNDPENLGAVARSARALGIDGLVLDPTCIDPYTRRTVRVSMGEILFLPCCRIDADEWPDGAFGELRASGFETWAMTPAAGGTSIWEVPIPDRLAVAFGAEGPGLAERTLAAAERRVCLPIHVDVDSLNVAAAAAATFAILDRPTHA